MDSKGFFTNVDPIIAEHGRESEVWQTLVNEKVPFLFVFKNFLVHFLSQMPRDLRVRGLFIDNISGPVLQMLGTR